jgi:hypothetical protein
MKNLATAALALGVISLVIGVFLRVLSKTLALGLESSSFLEFSIACFLLSIAINVGGNK